MLLTLNDDCLQHICGFLNFTEQCALAHTCQRLQGIVESNLRHECKNVNIDREQCSWFDKHQTYLYEFMECICENVENLQFESIEAKTLRLLEKLSFPKTISFSVDFNFTSDDEDTKLIAKLFPNLEKLSLSCSQATGNYLWNLKNLTELNLSVCEELDTKYFKKIFSTLPLKKLDIMYHGYNKCFDELGEDIAECKTLEEIIIDDHHLLLFIDKLPTLKKLRKLVVYTRDYDEYLLEKIVKQSGDSIDTIMFDYVFWGQDKHCESVGHMRNLRRLLLHDDYFEGEQLKLIGKSLKNTLQEFRYIDGQRSDSIDEGLIGLLSDCKKLEIFDISKSKFDSNFLQTAINRLCVDIKYRKKPLIFRCFDTKITAEDAELLTIPGYLEISLEKENVELPGSRCFQLEWKLPEREPLA